MWRKLVESFWLEKTEPNQSDPSTENSYFCSRVSQPASAGLFWVFCLFM